MRRLIKYECSENFSGHYWIILYIPPTAKLDCFLEPYLGYSTQLPLLPPTAADFKLSKETTKLDIQTTASRQHLCSTKVEQYETQSLRSAPHNHPTQLYLPIDIILFYDKSSRSQFKDINKHHHCQGPVPPPNTSPALYTPVDVPNKAVPRTIAHHNGPNTENPISSSVQFSTIQYSSVKFSTV